MNTNTYATYDDELRALENEIDSYVDEVSYSEMRLQSYVAGNLSWTDLTLRPLDDEEFKKVQELREYVKNFTADYMEEYEYKNSVVEHLAKLRKRYTYLTDMIEIDEAVTIAKKNGVLPEVEMTTIIDKGEIASDDFGAETYEWIH